MVIIRSMVKHAVVSIAGELCLATLLKYNDINSLLADRDHQVAAKLNLSSLTKHE